MGLIKVIHISFYAMGLIKVFYIPFLCHEANQSFFYIPFYAMGLI